MASLIETIVSTVQVRPPRSSRARPRFQRRCAQGARRHRVVHWGCEETTCGASPSRRMCAGGDRASGRRAVLARRQTTHAWVQQHATPGA